MYKLAIFSWSEQLDYLNDCIATERQLKLTMKRIIAKKTSSAVAKETAKGVLHDLIQREQQLVEQRDQAQASVSLERDHRLATVATNHAAANGVSGIL